jgi:hypothetical protein
MPGEVQVSKQAINLILQERRLLHIDAVDDVTA